MSDPPLVYVQRRSQRCENCSAVAFYNPFGEFLFDPDMARLFGRSAVCRACGEQARQLIEWVAWPRADLDEWKGRPFGEVRLQI